MMKRRLYTYKLDQVRLTASEIKFEESVVVVFCLHMRKQTHA